jgi:hypothetical protein
VKGGRLARAIRTNQRQDFAFVDLEIEVLDSAQPAEPFIQASDLKQG